MEFLKEIYGDKALTYDEFVQAINAHNGAEGNKDKQIKLENINSGNYVSKLKYEDIVAQLSGKDTELTNANNLIAELKKASKGNEDMQKKFTDYESENARLQKELQEAESKYAFEVMLMDAGVTDKDEREFLAYKYESKLKEEGKSLELDENKHIKGAEGIVESLKTMRPKAFETASTGKEGYQVLGDNKLPGNDDRTVIPTKEQFGSMDYEARVALKQQNEQVYRQLAKN